MNSKDQELSTVWQHKIRAANEYYKKWETKFKCKTLEQYLEGFQWAGGDNESYTLNLFFATFAVKRPSLLFRQPIYFVEPEPGHFNSFPEEAFNWASNATDVLNTFITSGKLAYGENLEMCIVDSLSHFGIAEVGYSAKWIQNPNLKKPEIPVDEFKPVSSEEPEFIPEYEQIYVKRIPAHRFRIGGNDCFQLEKADWCGYYEFIRYSDIKSKRSGFKNIDDISYSGYRTDELVTTYNEEDDQLEHSGELTKAWKIWDLRKHIMYIFTDAEGILIYEEPFDRLPLFDLRFFKRRKGWYPIPFTFNWKNPQDEINESREQVRSARRKAKTKWQIRRGAVLEEELDKLTSGPDGVAVLTETEEPIRPIAPAGLDAAVATVLQISKDDFNIAAGTTAEQRGETSRVTATQSTIINQRATIRESEEREIVATWLKRIGLEVLYQIIENFTLPMWVKVMGDPGAFFQDVPELSEEWKQLSSEQLGLIDFKVNVSVETLSPVANDIEKKKFMEFLAILNQYPQLSLHPDLIRELAFRLDYRNNKVVKAFQQAAVMQLAQQAAMAEQQIQGGGSNLAQKTVEQTTPPTQAEIENQLASQGMPVQ